jgi:hypothetical protein
VTEKRGDEQHKEKESFRSHQQMNHHSRYKLLENQLQ